MRGGVQRWRCCGKISRDADIGGGALAGLSLGGVPRLVGEVNVQKGVEHGDISASATGFMFSILPGVVFFSDIVTVVVVVGFLFCCSATLLSNNALRCATVHLEVIGFGN